VTEFGLAAAQAQAPGAKITREPYPYGVEGLQKSLRRQIEKIREGRLDPRVKGWATRALLAAGLDGRDRPSVVSQFRALLNAQRAQTTWVPDAEKAEVIESAAVVLCVDEHFCIPGTDCDGQLVTLASSSYAITNPRSGQSPRVFLVVQFFGPGQQPHVLVGVEDEHGVRHRGDPSTRADVDVGLKPLEEQWIDPLEANTVLNMPAMGAELVTVGRPAHANVVVTFGRAPLHPMHASLPVSFETRSEWNRIGFGAFHLYITIGEVQELMRRTYTRWESMRVDVDRCFDAKTLSDDETRSFYLNYNSWTIFYQENLEPIEPLLGTVYDQTVVWDQIGFSWQQKLKDKCKLTAPITKPESDRPLLPPLTTPESESTIRTVAIAGAVIVGIGFAGYLAFEAIQLIKLTRVARPAIASEVPRGRPRRSRLVRTR